MSEAYIVAAVRSAGGKKNGRLSTVHPIDLGALVVDALVEKSGIAVEQIDDLIFGCVSQVGAQSSNVARNVCLSSVLGEAVPGTTVDRQCGSGQQAIHFAAQAVMSGTQDVVIAGGVESMSRAPFVMPKATSAFTRVNAVYDTTIGWRFVNPKMEKTYGIDSMPQTADNVAADYNINREDQDAFAARSQDRWDAAQKAGVFADEIAPVTIPQRKGDDLVVGWNF